MTFNLQNGIRKAWIDIKDPDLQVSYFLFSLIGLAFFANENMPDHKTTLLFILIYEILFNMFYIFIRCWDEPRRGNPGGN